MAIDPFAVGILCPCGLAFAVVTDRGSRGGGGVFAFAVATARGSGGGGGVFASVGSSPLGITTKGPPGLRSRVLPQQMKDATDPLGFAGILTQNGYGR